MTTVDALSLAELLAAYKNALQTLTAARSAVDAAVAEAARLRAICWDRLLRAGQDDIDIVALLGGEERGQ